MDDDRFYDRGTFRYVARPSSYPHQQQNCGSYDSQYTHSSSRAYCNSQFREEGHRYPPQQERRREGEWGYTSTPPSRSPPSLHESNASASRHQAVTYQPPTSATPGLPSRSEWLVLPSVSHALSMYGDHRRTSPRFSLVIRQQPRRGLAIGNSQMSLRTARSIPIDPPPVCELLIDRSGDEQLLSLPEVFIRAQLVRGDSPQDECLPDARRIEPLVGDTLQSPFNSRIDTREDQSFFVFKELGVRNRGLYRLRFDLFDRVGLRVFKIASVYSDVFEVQERRKHPGLSASSALMDALVDRGMKYKLRKANDKAGAKKRKSPEDFYYGDERQQVRRQSYAAGERFEGHFAQGIPGRSPGELVRPVPRRAEAPEFREMLPPLRQSSTQRLSPTFRADKAPQLPSLSRLAPQQQQQRSYPVPQLRLSPSSLPPHPQLRYDESRYNRTLSPLTDSRPALEFRSSSSSVATSNSTGGERLASTPSSSTTEGTPYHNADRPTSLSAAAMGSGVQSKLNNPSPTAESRMRNGSPASTSSSGSNGIKPTLPPISSLYTPSEGRRPSAF